LTREALSSHFYFRGFRVNKMEKIEGYCYIYGLIDPRDDEIRYVGKANDPDKRYIDHFKPYSLKKKTYKNNWLKCLRDLELKPILIILEQVSIEDWIIKEREWISYFGRDNLTNGTDGGDGMNDSTGEIGKKISESRKGIVFSDEHLKNMSISHMGYKRSEESKKKTGDAHRGVPRTEETKRKLSEINKGRFVSEETRKRQSEARKGIPISEEHKIKDRDSLRGLKKNENTLSKYVGVTISDNKRKKKWMARIVVDKKVIHLGRFYTEEEAAIAYNNAALKYFGENARLNNIL
jgi:hypothetical protein